VGVPVNPVAVNDTCSPCPAQYPLAGIDPDELVTTTELILCAALLEITPQNSKVKQLKKSSLLNITSYRLILIKTLKITSLLIGTFQKESFIFLP
jgi:hypothetical protein